MKNWASPTALIEKLIDSVHAMGFPPGPLSDRQVQALTSLLAQANRLLEEGNVSDGASALQNYRRQVLTLVDDLILTAAQDQELIGPVEAILKVLHGNEINGYRLLEELGRGGLGTVYKALDLELKKIVAIKILSPALKIDEALVRRFKSRSRALALIESPHVVRINRLRKTEVGLFIDMEYVDGGTVADHILVKGRISWRESVRLVEQMLSGLSDAHGAGFVHRDIKPRNILLSRSGLVKITDFDLTNVLQRDAESTTAQWESTVPQEGAGTPYYLSPEQVTGFGRADQRSDLYSIGLTMYEMLTGRLPFSKEDSMFTIIKSIVEEELPSPAAYTADLPEDLVNIIEKALRKDPNERYQSAEEMLAAVRLFQEQADSRREMIPHSAPIAAEGGDANSEPMGQTSLRTADEEHADRDRPHDRSDSDVSIHRPENQCRLASGTMRPQRKAAKIRQQKRASTREIQVPNAWKHRRREYEFRPDSKRTLKTDRVLQPQPIVQHETWTKFEDHKLSQSAAQRQGERQRVWTARFWLQSWHETFRWPLLKPRILWPSLPRLTPEMLLQPFIKSGLFVMGGAAVVLVLFVLFRTEREAISALPTALLEITTAPSGAVIRIDGEERGRTPGNFSIEPGNYRLEAMLNGFLTHFDTLTVSERRKYAVDIQLKPALGTLVVSSNPTRAKIFLNGEDTGLLTPATLADLMVRTHRLRLVRSGYRNYDSTIVVTSPVTNVDVGLEPGYGILRISSDRTAALTITNKITGRPVVSGRLISATRSYSGRLRSVSHNVKITPIKATPKEVSIMIYPDSTIFRRFKFD